MRFLTAFAAATLAASAALLAANVAVDPYGIFGAGRYPVLTATSRAEKIARLHDRQPSPRALILGSSIMMRFDPAVVTRLTGLPAFNLSVDSAKTEDFVALLDYAVRDAAVTPALVIVGLSPRTFTPLANEGIDERLLASDRLLRYVPMNPFVRAWRRGGIYLGTLDWTYVTDVERSVRLSRTAGGNVERRYTFEPDGFLRSEEPFNQPGWYERWLKVSGARPVEGISEERRRYFERLRRRCREIGAGLLVIVTPEDPEAIDHENARNGGYDRQNRELMAYLTAQAAHDPFVVHNFHRIEEFGGVNEFMGSHPSIRNGTLMLERALAGRR